MKITVTGDEGVPVQVDGEAWIQQPGVVYITHKNRAQMLTRHKVLAAMNDTLVVSSSVSLCDTATLNFDLDSILFS